MLFQSNLVLQLVTPQKRRGTETRQHKSVRFRRGRRAWMAPTGVSRAKVIAGLGTGLDRNRRVWTRQWLPEGCRLRRRCRLQIDQAFRSQYCDGLINVCSINGLRRCGIDVEHRFLGRSRPGRRGWHPWITAAATRTIWEPLGYGAIPCAAWRCIASNRTLCRVALGTGSATVTQCLR